MSQTTRQNIIETKFHQERIQYELKRAKVSRFGLMKSASRYLPHVIHYDEHIEGVIHGLSDEGSIMLIATNYRLIYLDKKPFYINQDEVSYDVVTGVKFSHAGLGSTVTLHTRIKDYQVRTFDNKSAQHFIRFIEHLLEHNPIRKDQL